MRWRRAGPEVKVKTCFLTLLFLAARRSPRPGQTRGLLARPTSPSHPITMASAAATSARQDAKHERALKALLKLEDNRKCADCDTLVRERKESPHAPRAPSTSKGGD